MKVTHEMREMANQLIEAADENRHAEERLDAAQKAHQSAWAAMQERRREFLALVYRGAPAAQYVSVDIRQALVMAELAVADD